MERVVLLLNEFVVFFSAFGILSALLNDNLPISIRIPYSICICIVVVIVVVVLVGLHEAAAVPRISQLSSIVVIICIFLASGGHLVFFSLPTAIIVIVDVGTKQ